MFCRWMGKYKISVRSIVSKEAVDCVFITQDFAIVSKLYYDTWIVLILLEEFGESE